MITQTEPGCGLYRDAHDQASGHPGFWEHDEPGWRRHNGLDDPNPGAWRGWEDVQRYGPFTPINAPATYNPLETNGRRSALDFASRCNPADATQLIQYAMEIEQYLTSQA